MFYFEEKIRLSDVVFSYLITNPIKILFATSITRGVFNVPSLEKPQLTIDFLVKRRAVQAENKVKLGLTEIPI